MHLHEGLMDCLGQSVTPRRLHRSVMFGHGCKGNDVVDVSLNILPILWHSAFRFISVGLLKIGPGRS